MDKVVKTFRTVAQVPSVAAAKILKYGSSKESNQISVYSWWSQRCLERGKSIKFQKTYIINTCNEEIVDLMPVDASNEIISSFSPSEELRAVVRDIQSQENGSKKLQHLEIWKKSQLSSVSDLTALDVHGDVYADSEFGCFEWSPCEKKILYIAEKKVPKSEPFYKQKAQGDEKKGDTGSGDSKVTKGEEYIYRQDWGEQLVGKHQPVVVVFDIREEKIVLLEGIPDNLSPAKATWAPDGGIVGVAWENEPRRLGLMFCTNRPSYIFHLTSDGNFKILSEKGLAVRAPRFSPDGKKLIWLERPAGGPHHNAQRLIKYCWTSGKTDIVIDIVNNKLDTVNPLYFRGVYNQGFPKRCWLSDNEHIVFSTPGPSSITSCLVNTDNKKITLIKPFGDEECSSVILDVTEDTILCTRSTFRHPASLVIGKLSSSNYENIEWISVTKYECFPGLSNAKQGLYYTTATSHVTNDVNEINAIYLQPATDPAQKVPVIIYPHGGPHANFVNSFSAQAAFFVMLGYGVVMVNYRGSTGFGQDYTNFLLGKIGDSDVKDMHQVAEELCNSSLANFDSSRKVLFGGSHGGFLVCHLSGQYPETFKAVVTVNPVTDVASMIGVTDIPDWCAVESGEAYSPSGETTKEDFNKMHDASPIRYAKQVTAPTLLLIGKKDLRVPPSQGLQYHYKLKAHNIKTKLLLYEDNHPLAQVPVEMDSLINSALWFNEHLNIAQE